jgi:hypothetical protein
MNASLPMLGLPRNARAWMVAACAAYQLVGSPRACLAEPTKPGLFVRARVLEPAGERFTLVTGGHLHKGPDVWNLPAKTLETGADGWTPWLDAKALGLHGRRNRVGGLAEWPSLKLTVKEPAKLQGVKLRVQLADAAADDAVVLDFTESSGSATIAFLLVSPLREKQDEFETGSQMTARHLAWAREASGGKAPDVGRFKIISAVWAHYDPILARQAAETLHLLGMNVSAGVPPAALEAFGMETYIQTSHFVGDPEKGALRWERVEKGRLAKALATPAGAWIHRHLSHVVIADEVQSLKLRALDQELVSGWFRGYLRDRGETDESLGTPLDSVRWLGDPLYDKLLPRTADLATRKLAYHSAKFLQWWSARQLRTSSDLIRGTYAALDPPVRVKTETLPGSHAFFNAWGSPTLGMGAVNLDLFEIGRQESVDVVSAEDWLGLNHMYGPGFTWLGGQGFGYLSSVLRGGIRDRAVELRGLITPSDDRYLRLKAYSNLGQGSKSIFFWTFGPTYIGTENYWSDLRSMYDGVAKTSRALARAEPVLYPARTVSDPVAILHSVSHDIWHTAYPAVFVETRLLYAALRHLSIQPDFLGEEEVEAGLLDRYKVLYLPGNCLTRKAAAAVDAWVRKGGVLYLSAGAATRDEFFEPHVPAFAAAVYPAEGAANLKRDKTRPCNERKDLPVAVPMTTAAFAAGDDRATYDCIAYRMDLSGNSGDGCEVIGKFADGAAAAMRAGHGAGTVFAVGFLPGLDYSPFKAGQTTLDERWDGELRAAFRAPLAAAGIRPVVAASVPVVEANLLTGPAGSAIVLANYTYEPIPNLTLSIGRDLGHAIGTATSTEGVPVKVRRDGDRIVLDLPLEWTDIVLLPKP